MVFCLVRLSREGKWCFVFDCFCFVLGKWSVIVKINELGGVKILGVIILL